MRIPWRIVAIWGCFLARAIFYCSMLPIWEGYDEWAHFAVIRTMAQGELLVARNQPVPRDVEESLRIAPVPWELRYLPAPAATQDVYWTLTASERQQRERQFREMPAGWRNEEGGLFTAYEALQPPLYYWILAPVLRFMGGAALPTQVLVLRWLTAVIASLAIPLVLLVARDVFGEERVALGCAAVVSLMPGFALDIARVGNEALAVVLFTGLIWLLLKNSPRGAAGLLALGLLTKAYFLTAIPAVVVRVRRHWWVLLTLVAAVSGWWYVRNVVTTGTISGLSESVMLRNLGLPGMIRRVPSVPWRTAVDSILFSHLYFAGWSSLMVRSWMYHVFYLVAGIAAVGLIWQLRKQSIRWLIAVYGLFWIGQLYNVLLLYLSKGLPGSMGWYMYAVVAAEVVLCVAGFGRFRRWAAVAGAILFGIFDLYTMHAVAIPYYTGMIRHKANAALTALHISDFRAVGFSAAFERLAINKGPLVSTPLLIGLWVAYLAATFWLIAFAQRRTPDRGRK